MAGLILEIVSRHGSRYHPLDRPVIRIGRALDNDVIIDDPTISPYHCIIRRRADGNYELVPLADENGLYLGKNRVEDALNLSRLPLTLDAGHTRFRLSRSDQPVAPTRLIGCRSGRGCILSSWPWAVTLFALMLLLSALENHSSTFVELTWKSFWSDQVMMLGVATILVLGLLGVIRLVSQRWDLPSSIAFVGLTLATIFLIDHLAEFGDYYFSSNLPSRFTSALVLAIVLPAFTGWFLVRFHHGKPVAAWVIIVLLFTPSAYLEIRNLSNQYDFFDTFSKRAYYNRTLYPLDTRIKATESIADFSENNLLNRIPPPADSR